MKLLRVGPRGAERPAAIDPDGALRDLSSVVPDLDGRSIAAGGLGALGSLALEALPPLDPGQRIGPPITAPRKIVCVGLNYRTHALEAGLPVPDEPVLFLKTPDTLGGPTDPVLLPPGSRKTDYEVELAVVIGRTARHLPDHASALDHVLGYAITNDVSERAYQLERGGQWDKGKNCDGFNPFGPWLVTADDVPDPQALHLTTTVNGELRQDCSTADMVFPVDALVRYVSQFMTLHPGDIINTGTPHGVGAGFDPPRFVAHGDVVETTITGLGAQRVEFVAADALVA